MTFVTFFVLGVVFFTTMPRGWLGKTSPKGPILYRVECKTLTCDVLLSELFYTEKAHVRILKVLQRIFYQPMRDETCISADFVNRLFPNIDELVELHCELYGFVVILWFSLIKAFEALFWSKTSGLTRTILKRLLYLKFVPSRFMFMFVCFFQFVLPAGIINRNNLPIKYGWLTRHMCMLWTFSVHMRMTVFQLKLSRPQLCSTSVHSSSLITCGYYTLVLLHCTARQTVYSLRLLPNPHNPQLS